MPIYDFRCKECGYTFERMQKISDKNPTECPDCNKKDTVTRLVTGGSFVLKGNNWFKNSGSY